MKSDRTDLPSHPDSPASIRRRRILLALGGLGVAAHTGAAAAAVTDSPAAEGAAANSPAHAITAFIDGYIAQYGFVGASLAISRHGRLVYQHGFGYADIEARTRPDPAQTLFRIASVSKPITSIAVFRLLEASGGDIDTQLNRPVFGKAGYLPEYTEIRDKRVLKITLRDLLQHTGGWDASLGYDPQYDLFNIARQMNVPAPADAATVIRYMLKYKPLDVAPGQAFHYSNLGYNILGRVVEKLSGLSYELYVRAMVTGIGVGDMHIAGDLLADRRPQEARYYDDPRAPREPSMTDGVTLVPPSYGPMSFTAMDAHGGWLGTPVDLVQIGEAITPGSGSGQLLAPRTIALMGAPVAGIGDPTAAMGWVSTDNGATLSHGGALMAGSFAYLSRRADGMVWAILFNRLPVAGGADIGPLASALMSGMTSRLDALAASLG